VSCNRLTESFGQLLLDTIATAHVESFKLERSEEVSPAGTNRDLAALRSMLNYAMRKGLINRNPVHGVKLLPEPPGRMRIVSQEEQRKYLGKANQLLRDVATMILETGMRPEEVFTIRKENVHLPQGYVFVPTGKTRFARRNIPLTDATKAVLKRRMRATKSPFVVPSRYDPSKPLTTVKKAHEVALREAKIKPRFRLYDLRHTFGSRSAMAGIDPDTQRANGALRYLYHDAVHTPHARAQTGGPEEAGKIQR